MDPSQVSSSSLLQCAICQDLLLPGAVRQCRNGHNICEEHMPTIARQHQNKCPTCRIPFSSGSSRNLLAEQLVQEHRRRQENGNAAQARATTPATRNESGLTLSTGIAVSVTASGDRSPAIFAPGGRVARAGPAPRPTQNDNNNNNRAVSLCAYTKDGCDYSVVSSDLRSIGQHEGECHFRPLNCCLGTDLCHHAQIAFFDYILHLRGHHGVKFLQGSHHLNKYVVKLNGPSRKFVREGSTSLFILEVANQAFVVRAKEKDDWIYVWVAFHGHPDVGRLHKAEIQYNPQYEEDNEQSIRPRSLNLAWNGGESSRVEEDDDIFTGNVIATTRQTWEEVEGSQNYLCMPVSDVGYNLKHEAFPGRNYSIDSWAVTVTITRERPQPQNQNPGNSS